MKRIKKYKVIILSSLIFILSASATRAAFNINVQDLWTQTILEDTYFENLVQYKTQEARIAADKAKQTLGSKLFHATVGTALKTIAYDTATWLGSAGKGQKPLFITEGWDKYLANAADNAAGSFIEVVGKNFGEIMNQTGADVAIGLDFNNIKVNFCKPDFNAYLKIGLGLKQYARPTAPTCSFSKLKSNWDQALTQDTFLNDFQDMFNPTSNDLGISLKLQTGMIQAIEADINTKTKGRSETGGWLDINTLIAGKRTAPPDYAKNENSQLGQMFKSDIGKYTGDVVTDAANIFLNQLAITALKTLMANLGKKDSTSPYDWSKITSFSGDPNRYNSAKESKARADKILRPDFSIRGDYSILTELAQCPDPTKAGPTNCVIDDKLRQAISQKKTVGEAIKLGYLNGEKIVGFSALDVEPNYMDGYPYRSLLILRKFRILPVGWEIAAQYIRDNILNNTVGAKTLSDLVACYNQNDQYPGYYDTWCQGLVDPDWVLKAPLNFCKREGPGPENISKDDSIMSRNTKYCADEQSCIKEKADGSCEYYGYCTEERRIWKFNTETCEPLFNTCQTFKKEDGSSISYLKNTLDYNGCTVDNVGCTAYCTDFDFATGKYNCTNASIGNKIYLDRDAEACDASAEGCQALIRQKDGLGANVLQNTSFENDFAEGGWDTWGVNATTTSDSYHASAALHFTAAGSYEKTVLVGPDVSYGPGYGVYSTEGEAFTLSLTAKNCGAGSTIGMFDGVNTNTVDISTGGASWSNYSVTQIFLNSSSSVSMVFNVVGANCLIDAIKLEHGRTASAYSDYGQSGLVHEKLAPDYLKCDGVADPTECNNFARNCKAEEVGCELYTPANGDLPVPGKVKPIDYCRAECVNFDTYLQSTTIFDSSRPEHFIPKTAKACSAAVNGCDQFTNLDKVGSGAESTEYYTYLRQCITTGGAQFYSWEGSDETGFQLKVITLKDDNDGDDIALDLDGNPATANVLDYAGDPAITGSRIDENVKCNERIYLLPQSSPGYNPDCREYYNEGGDKSYHLYSQTISIDPDCHPYRRTENNVLYNVNTQVLCEAQSVIGGPSFADVHFDNVTNECVKCVNGGTWTADQGCVYQAIPDEGVKCSAAMNGCREYTGNTGQSVRIVMSSAFEGGTTDNWASTTASSISSASESIVMGGHSLQVITTAAGNGITITLPTSTLIYGRAYAINFIAKTYNAVNLTARMGDGSATASTSFSALGGLTGDWKQYRANLIENTIVGARTIIIEGDSAAQFFIDDIKLTEISNRYYLIKNSWITPDVCNQDLNGNPHPLYMLGCQKYADRDKKTLYLRSFSYLCSEGSVGCELMINTFNSDVPAEKEYNLPNTNVDYTIVPEDRFVYAAFDKSKTCAPVDQGCQRLGKPYIYEGEHVYSDVFLRNNPNKYNKILCNNAGVDCDQYAAGSSISFFKNPGDLTCEWRQVSNNEYSWYKKKVKRCGATGALCSQDQDCTSPQKCEVETIDRLCPTDATSTPKTFGLGTGSRTIQPMKDSLNWVGVCPADESSCTEYIDPQTTFNQNILFNGEFTQNINTSNDPLPPANIVPDGWQFNAGLLTQSVKLVKNTLYSVSGYGNAGSVVIVNCTNGISKLNENLNSLDGPLMSLALTLGVNPNKTSMQFYSNGSDSCQIRVLSAGSIANLKVVLRKSAVDYQLSQNIDLDGCNGQVDSSQGCVLFNERSLSGGTLSELIYDSDLSSSAPVVSAGVERDSNVLIKVAPDRVCDQWLACKTSVSVKDQEGSIKNTCVDVGLCNQFDFKGGCGNFINKEKTNQIFNYSVGPGLDYTKISNISGYAKVGKNQPGQTDAQLPLASMEQSGAAAKINNGNMEMSGENGYPTGWKFFNSADVWDANSFKIINTYATVQEQGVGRAPEGKGILKLGIKHEITSYAFSVKPQEQYILQASVNTTRIKGSSTDRIRMRFICDDGTLNGLLMTEKEILPGQGWHSEMTVPITTGVACSMAMVRFFADPGLEGNYFVDDVKLKPTLQSRVGEYLTQSCRLFPKSSALSCDYKETSGVRYSGWYGYCLEYDRYPGNSNSCLLWWPVEKINGDFFGKDSTFKGYGGKFPAQYCAELDGNYRYVEKRSASMIAHESRRKSGGFWSLANFGLAILTSGISWAVDDDVFNVSQNIESGGPSCPIGMGYMAQQAFQDCNPGFFGRCNVHLYTYCVPASRKYKVSNAGQTNDEWSGGAWYQYNGSLINYKNISGVKVETETLSGLQILDMNSPVIGVANGQSDGIQYKLVDPKDYDFLPCKKFYETVSDTGDNKAWLGRLGEDSKYTPTPNSLGLIGLGYEYKQDDAPFGSAVPPEPVDNPYDWDASSLAGRQPLSYWLPESKQVRAGSPYDCIGDKCIKVGHCKDSGKTCVTLRQSSAAVDLCAGSPLVPGSVSDGMSAKSNYLQTHDCYESTAAAVTPSEVYETRCTNNITSAVCVPMSTATCACGIVATGLAAPAPVNVFACQLTGTGNVATGLPGDPCASSTSTINCDGDFCNPGLCAGGVAATCGPNLVGVANISTAAGGGADDLAWWEPNVADSDNIKASIPPSYGCALKEECIITSQPDWPVPPTHAAYYTQISAIDHLKRMFAKNYGVWNWNPATRHYEKSLNPAENWDVANAPLCVPATGPRPEYPNDYCRIRPIIDPPLVSKTIVNGGDSVNLTFTSHVDVNQLPLVYINIDWGDGSSETIVTGEFSDRPNPSDPHVFSHYYSYSALSSCTTAICSVTPVVKIMDNWGTESLSVNAPVISITEN